MSKQWQERKRPNRLERRYEFPDYPALRDFLDHAAELSERDGLYPDIGFGRDYANITIHAEEGADTLGDPQRRFAEQLDALYPGHATH
ncbi:MAG: 4a-hydroxytetrahydrobiopterin dehydratase [Thiogranum sp.]|jgi:4a-hydroxytetrahydrobiopterin dehydratase